MQPLKRHEQPLCHVHIEPGTVIAFTNQIRSSGS